MKNLKTLQTLSKMGKILSRIAFVFAIIGACGCIIGLLSVIFGNGSAIKIGGVTLHSMLAISDNYNLKSVSAVLAEIVQGIAAGFMNVEATGWMDMHYDNEASVVLGIMFLVGSVICSYGAELSGEKQKMKEE